MKKMFIHSCRKKLKKVLNTRIDGVNLIGRSVYKIQTIGHSSSKQKRVLNHPYTFEEFKEIFLTFFDKRRVKFVPIQKPLSYRQRVRTTLSFVSLALILVSLSYFTINWLQKVLASDPNPYSWGFAVSGDYAVSDSNLLEIISNSARFKVRNYVTDGNTRALYHFDELNGVIASDSSGNGNTGLIASGTYVPGNLNNGLLLNGTVSGVSAPDSTSLSVTSNLTLEGWTQFLTAFSGNTVNVGTHQPFISKGSYQLYYDNQTGKLSFELAPLQSPDWTWTQYAGGVDLNSGSEVVVGGTGNGTWDFNGKPSVNAMVKMGADIYVGLGDYTNASQARASDAEVWKYTTSTQTWSLIGGDGIGWANETFQDVMSLATDGTNLYAGLGSQPAGMGKLYKWDGTTWTKIGGDSAIAGSTGPTSWQSSTYEAVTALTVAGSGTAAQIIAGLGLSAGDAEVWRCKITDNCSPTQGWIKIGGDGIVAGTTANGPASWAQNTYELVTSIAMWGNSVIVGLGNSTGDAEVWKCADYRNCKSEATGTGWTRIGEIQAAASTTPPMSWSNATYEVVTGMYVTGNDLYVGLGNNNTDGTLWRCNLNICAINTGWSLLGSTTNWGTVEQVWGITGDANYIYAGLGNTQGANDAANDSEIWRFQISSGFTNPVLDMIGGSTTIGYGIPFNTQTNVRSLLVDGTTLYAGMQNQNLTNTGEVWKCNIATAASCKPNWDLIAGNYVRKSWGYYNMQSAESMATVNGKLYIGTGNNVNGNANIYGNATVWQYDETGSSPQWSMIGGQSINSSWGFLTNLASVSSAPYEEVASMVNYKGKLYVGLGSNNVGASVRDAEVWGWEIVSPNTWTKVGGDNVRNSWDGPVAENHETVRSLAVWYCSGSATNLCIFAGLGDSNNDAEVWEYDGNTWVIRGGDAAANWNTNGNHNYVNSLLVYNGALYAGVSGDAANESEVWKWSGTGNAWTKVGGDGVNSSWNTSYETVDSMVVFRNELYVGLGINAGDAEVWKWNGTAWTFVGGDGTGWADNTYETVKSLTVYNGELYAGLGNSQYDAEIWRYRFDGSNWVWSKVGGDDINGSWTDAAGFGRERVTSMGVYRGRLFTETGDTGNNDAAVWAFGNNYLLTSNISSQDTNWHHIAATYDSDSMRLYIDGVLDNSRQIGNISVFDNTSNFYIGAEAGSNMTNVGSNNLNARVDEVRVSNTARSSFNTTPYTQTQQTVRPVTPRFASGVGSYQGFTATNSGGGTVTYRLSNDGGNTWYWYNSGWVQSNSLNDANTQGVINSNIRTFTPLVSNSNGVGYGLLWQAIMSGDGTQRVTLSNVTINVNEDNPPVTGGVPFIPTSFNSLSSPGGGPIFSGTWASTSTPYFSWSGASDDTNGNSSQDANESGVAGYWVYFGTDNTAMPSSAGVYIADPTVSIDTHGRTILAGTTTPLVSGTSYYFRAQVQDKAGNLSVVYPTIGGHQYFEYKFDSTPPNVPGGTITVVHDGTAQGSLYAPSNHFMFSWDPVTDGGSGLAGYQYQIGEQSSLTEGGWSAITTDTTTGYLDNVAYTIGSAGNMFWLRTVDNTGNVSIEYKSLKFYWAGSGPSSPQSLAVTAVSGYDNYFRFTWTTPSTYAGTENGLTYCWVVNAAPTPERCNTSHWVVQGAAHTTTVYANATDLGVNTFYVVAKNEDASGGAVGYGAPSQVNFEAAVTSPGVPENIDIADVSVKSESSWKLAISWEYPTGATADTLTFEIYRATEDVDSSYTESASTTGIAFVDTGLEQKTYYYKVRACDKIMRDNCGVFTSAVSMLPTGKWTSAAGLSAEPKVTSITTKRATIDWSTDRSSDSKISYGKKSGTYFTSEPSNSTQTTDHSISLTDLAPGTKYYFKAKWTDEDGNTGISKEYTFSTQAAPVVTDPKVKVTGIDNMTLEYTVKGASKVRIYYGETSTFGGTFDLSTSTSETTYDTNITSLKDGTKYFYKINTFDTEGDEYDGSILTFETLPRPKIENVRIQQVKGTAQPTMLVVWETNTEVSSIISYYPAGNPTGAKDIVNVALVQGRHRALIENLQPQTPYALVVSGRDKGGNEARSDVQSFTTATDTRPPMISGLKVEGAVVNSGGSDQQKLAQLMVSWDTDEAATSQVEFGEGSGTTYSQRTQEDTSLTFNHVVVISNLVPSRVYHLKSVSKDVAANEGYSIDTVTITPKATDSALNLVIANLGQVFGFLNGLAGQ